MAQTTYQITLSTGGKVAVTVAADDPGEMKAGFAWAELAYGTWRTAKKEERVNDDHVQEQQEDEIPICAVHNVAMARVKGKYGYFWSCHERNADGSFCSYKPEGR